MEKLPGKDKKVWLLKDKKWQEQVLLLLFGAS